MTKPWADKPFELLKIPGQPGAKSCDNPDVMFVSIEMANAHNALLRGLNSIYLQAPHVTKPEDIADFLLYAQAWAGTVHHHHTVEEQIFFPAVDRLVLEAGIADSSMDPNVDQHHLFEPQIEKFLKWVGEVRDGKKEYDSKMLSSLIDTFAPILTQHLHDEIDTLLKLEKCDGEKLKKCMKDTADESLKTADPNIMVPQILGCCDKTYPGSEHFPPVPFFLPYLNAYWFSRKHKGCWRFNPCDDWCKPRPLQFL